ncbi:hypothetical protein EVG20_g10337 [Dentipellis fragilis]|uniref:Uncharacterized protein n=1 Tax=Dentipellis fragilis TaxID=205917 RepID=A0A4Y9XUV0_9AGAM|nr:hypothetical protein EVG20_g10337 [Dentipellis fragilis]
MLCVAGRAINGETTSRPDLLVQMASSTAMDPLWYICLMPHGHIAQVCICFNPRKTEMLTSSSGICAKPGQSRTVKFTKYSAQRPMSVLFYGPLGSSKALLAKVIVIETRAYSISTKYLLRALHYSPLGLVHLGWGVRAVFDKARPLSISFRSRTLHPQLWRLSGDAGGIVRALLHVGRLDQLIYIPLPDEYSRLSCCPVYATHGGPSVSHKRAFALYGDLPANDELAIQSNLEANIRMHLDEIMNFARRSIFDSGVQQYKMFAHKEPVEIVLVQPNI